MNETNLDQIVYGAKKHARNQLTREQKTRFGLGNGHRCVVELPFESLAAKAPMPEASEEYDRMRNVIRAQIRERFTDKRDLLLIEARWFKELPLQWLSQKLGTKEATARIKVFRAKGYLRGDEPRQRQ